MLIVRWSGTVIKSIKDFVKKLMDFCCFNSGTVCRYGCLAVERFDAKKHGLKTKRKRYQRMRRRMRMRRRRIRRRKRNYAQIYSKSAFARRMHCSITSPRR
jgi:hypothetical protein